MLLQITKQQVIKILKFYYKKYEGEDANINIEVKKGYQGLYEQVYAHVNISVETERELLGETIKIKSTLNEDEVKSIFKTILQEENYDITDFRYDAFIDTEEYLCNSCKVAKFNGIKVEVKSNQKTKSKITG